MNTTCVTTICPDSAIPREDPLCTGTWDSPQRHKKTNAKHCAGQEPILTPQKDLELKLIRRVPEGATLQPGKTVYFLDSESGNFHDVGPCYLLYEKGKAVIAVLKSALTFSCTDGTDIRLCPGVWSISPIGRNLPSRGER
jgi:hypothetical protein